MVTDSLAVVPRVSQDEVIRQETLRVLHTEQLRLREAMLQPIVAICAEGYAKFIGIQGADPELGIEALVLFQPLHINTSLALPFSRLTADNVKAKVVAATSRFLGGRA